MTKVGEKQTATLWQESVAVQMIGTLAAPVTEGVIVRFAVAESNTQKKGAAWTGTWSTI
jgi:hypothetical protein